MIDLNQILYHIQDFIDSVYVEKETKKIKKEKTINTFFSTYWCSTTKFQKIHQRSKSCHWKQFYAYQHDIRPKTIYQRKLKKVTLKNMPDRLTNINN